MAYSKSFFDQADFMRYMQQNPEALAWLSKPEKAMKQRMKEYMGQKQMEKQVLVDQFQSVKELVEKRMIVIQEGICQALDVIDESFKGRAQEVLMQDEAGQEQARNTNLQLIEKTPNADNEETQGKNEEITIRTSIPPF